jgi:CheY-like chemotaxis protein
MTKVLIVEDNAATANMLFDTLGKATDIDRTLASQSAMALQALKGDSFDVVLVDLKLAQSQEVGPGKAIYDGVQLGEDIRKTLPGAVIVMYSGDIVPGREVEFPYYEDCRKAGADYILSRETLLEKSAKIWTETIEQWIKTKRADEALVRPLENDDDWNTLGVLETVGRDVLSQLIRQAIPGMARDSIRALQAGYSGAFVLWVTSSSKGAKKDIETILKISDSTAPLEEELRRVPIVGSALDLSSVLPHSSYVSWQEWHAIPIRPLKNATLLRDFLLQGTAKRSDHRIFSRLVSTLLIEPAHAAVPPNAASSRLLGYAAGSQILSTLEQIGTWRRTLSRVTAEDLRIVRRFVERSLQGHWSICGNHYVAGLHGDFHCRNIFVGPEGRAVLIDFGKSGVYPRLLDFAGLDADLLISLWDSQRGTDLRFDKVNRWFDFAVGSFPFETRPSRRGKSDARVAVLRRILHARMVDELDAVTSLEYSEALLFQFLRYIRFTATPAPKKILAVRLVAALLRQNNLV